MAIVSTEWFSPNNKKYFILDKVAGIMMEPLPCIRKFLIIAFDL